MTSSRGWCTVGDWGGGGGTPLESVGGFWGWINFEGKGLGSSLKFIDSDLLWRVIAWKLSRRNPWFCWGTWEAACPRTARRWGRCIGTCGPGTAPKLQENATTVPFPMSLHGDWGPRSPPSHAFPGAVRKVRGEGEGGGVEACLHTDSRGWPWPAWLSKILANGTKTNTALTKNNLYTGSRRNHCCELTKFWSGKTYKSRLLPGRAVDYWSKTFK